MRISAGSAQGRWGGLQVDCRACGVRTQSPGEALYPCPVAVWTRVPASFGAAVLQIHCQESCLRISVADAGGPLPPGLFLRSPHELVGARRLAGILWLSEWTLLEQYHISNCLVVGLVFPGPVLSCRCLLGWSWALQTQKGLAAALSAQRAHPQPATARPCRLER